MMNCLSGKAFLIILKTVSGILFRQKARKKRWHLLGKMTLHCAIVDIRLGAMDGNAFIREAYRENASNGLYHLYGLT